MEKNIFDMKLNECINLESDGQYQLNCIRVPGGWIYEAFFDKVCNSATISQAFVPIHTSKMKNGIDC